MSKIPSSDILESLHKLRIATQNCIGIVRHGDSSEDIDALSSVIEDTGEEEKRSETSIAKLPGAGELKQEQWSRVERDYLALKEEKVPDNNGKKKASVRRGISAVSGMRPEIARKNQNTLPPRLLSQPYHEVEVCRRKEVSKAKVTMVPSSDNRADIIWMVLARDRLVNIGILPSVNFTKQKRVAKPVISVCSRIARLMKNQTKSQRNAIIPTKEEKATTRCCGRCENCTTIVMDSQRGKQALGKPDAKSLGTDSKGTVHSAYATSSKYPGKERTIAWKNTSQSSSPPKSLRYEIWGPVPWRDWKTTAMRLKQGMEHWWTLLKAHGKPDA